MKASDLVTRYGGKQWARATAPVVVSATEKSRRIQGPKSSLVKFSDSLCTSCNTTATQPYDRAYEKLSAFLLRHRLVLNRTHALRFDRVYGAAYAKSVANLLGYFMKIFGCAMVDAGIPPPPGFVALIGKSNVSPFSMTFSINSTARDQLNHQVFAPLRVEAGPQSSACGVMMNGMFEFRLWWKIKPHAQTYGTVFSSPMKKLVVHEVPWGSSTLYHLKP